MPKAEPRMRGSAISAVQAWPTGWRALKNRLAVNSSSPMVHRAGWAAAVTYQAKATVSRAWTPVQESITDLRLQPRRRVRSESQPPAGKPMSPAPALKPAVRAAFMNEEWAAPEMMDTDQKLKNHRFHRIAMLAR